MNSRQRMNGVPDPAQTRVWSPSPDPDAAERL